MSTAASRGTLPAAAFFDLDGTLMDREPLMQAAIERTARQRGEEFADGELSVLIGRAWQDVFLALHIESRLGLDLGGFLDAIMTSAETLLADGFPARVLDGGAELIERLHGHGVPVMLVTGSLRREADVAIAQLGIAPHLVASLAAEEYVVGKPSPECYLAAAEMVGLPSAEEVLARCLVFEDSEPGIASGLAAGMKVIATSAANRPAGDPSHQRLDGAHLVVAELSEVSDDVLRAIVAGS
jgi:beta-phosphoglucomutase-like phosphatase (HAD superfamily)